MVLNEEIFYKRDGKVYEAQSQIKVANHFYRISSGEGPLCLYKYLRVSALFKSF